MRNWFVWFVVGSLFLLPFSGSSATVPAANGMNHHVMASSVVEHEPVSEHEMVVSEQSISKHCDTENQASKVAAPPTENAHHSSVDEETAASALADCCDNPTDCGTKCPSDCGHCVMFGHGCTAALNNLNVQAPILAFLPSTTVTSFYSLLTSKPTPPPIIA